MESRREGNEFCSVLRPDAAGAGEAPAAHGFNNGEQPGRHKNQPQPPEIITGDDDARDEAQGAHDAARHAPVTVKVRLEETAHGINLTHHPAKANGLLVAVQFAVFGARSIAPQAANPGLRGAMLRAPVKPCHYRVLKVTLASVNVIRHIASAMDLLNQNFLWASLIWGSIGSGYCIYGWKQRDAIPFFGGFAMIAVSCLVPALPMSLICLALMIAVYWLVKQGY
jgi:hypothetical protein